MRRFLTVFVVAAIAAVVPALALAGNQEVAEQIANRLRNSGQMVDYKIGVKYQDGTAWLRGQVSNEEQMKTALRLVFETASVDRIVNDLNVASSEAVQPEASPVGMDANVTPSSYNPLRETDVAPVADARQGAKPLSLAKRLESAIRGPFEKQTPAKEETPAYADQVPSSFAPEVVEPVTAEEPQELPRQLATPKYAKPTARMTREPARVAMQATRAPVAPNGAPMPMYSAANNQAGVAPARYDQPCMPNYAWPSYAAYPNYAAVTYPKQYSPTAWPYIGPFYPYPQVPLGWRKVTLEWDDGWWFLDFKDQPASCWRR